MRDGANEVRRAHAASAAEADEQPRCAAGSAGAAGRGAHDWAPLIVMPLRRAEPSARTRDGTRTHGVRSGRARPHRPLRLLLLSLVAAGRERSAGLTRALLPGPRGAGLTLLTLLALRLPRLTLLALRLPRLSNLTRLVLPGLTLRPALPLLLRLTLPRLARTALRTAMLHTANRPTNRTGPGAMAKRRTWARAKPARRTRRRQERLRQFGRVFGASCFGICPRHRGKGNLQQAKLLRQRLHNGAVAVVLALGACGEGLTQRTDQELHALGAEIRHRGQPGNLHRPPDDTLDLAHQARLARLHQRDRCAFATCAAGSTGPVDVDLRRTRDVVVDDMADVVDVEPARGNVRGNQHVQRVVAEAGHDPVPLLLRQTAVEGGGVTAAGGERLCKIVHFATGAGEDQGGGAVLKVQDPAKGGQLVLATDDVGHVANAGLLALGGTLRLHADADGVLEVALGEAGDGPGDGRGKQCGPTRGGQGAQDLVEVVGEAHVEHLVGLVEDHGLDVVKAQRATVDVINGAPGGCNHDVHATRQTGELRGDGLAAVHGDHAAADLAAVLVDGLGHLHRELARGREDQGGGPAAAAIAGHAAVANVGASLTRLVHVDGERLENRQGECGCLAGAGWGFGKKVAAGKQRRDGRGLHRGGLLVAEGGDGAQDARVQAKRRKAVGFDGLGGVVRVGVDRAGVRGAGVGGPGGVGDDCVGGLRGCDLRGCGLGVRGGIGCGRLGGLGGVVRRGGGGGLGVGVVAGVRIHA